MMAKSQGKMGNNLKARAFSWYWRSLFKRRGRTSDFHQLVSARRAVLDTFARRAEARLAAGRLATIDEAETIWRVRPDCLSRPLDEGAFADPQSGMRLGAELEVFHDSQGGTFTLSQRPNRAPVPKNRFEVFFESYEFEGSYLSFSLSVLDQLRIPANSEQLRLTLDLVSSRSMKGFVRLNMRSANGSDILYAEGAIGAGETHFDFDLSFASITLREGDTIWIDLILDRPRMLEFSLYDISLALLSKDHL